MDTTDIARLRQAVQLAPDDIETQLTFLQALVTAGAWQEADEIGTSLLHLPSPPAAVHALMAVVYSKGQRLGDAVQQSRQALEGHPDDALLLFNLGTLLAQQGDTDAALDYLDKAVVQREDWAEAHYNRGTVLLRQKRYREAITAFEHALEHQETYPEAHFSRGNAHAMLGLDADGTLDYYELDCAINAYKTAIQQRSGYTAALYNLGMLYGRMTSSEGLRVWEQYLDVSADRPAEDTWRLRAQEYKRDLQGRVR